MHMPLKKNFTLISRYLIHILCTITPKKKCPFVLHSVFRSPEEKNKERAEGACEVGGGRGNRGRRSRIFKGHWRPSSTERSRILNQVGWHFLLASPSLPGQSNDFLFTIYLFTLLTLRKWVSFFVVYSLWKVKHGVTKLECFYYSPLILTVITANTNLDDIDKICY